MNDEQKRLLTAFLLSGLVLFSWEFFFKPKQPAVNSSQVSKVSNPDLKPGTTNGEINSDTQASKTGSVIKKETLSFAGPSGEIVISNDLNLEEIRTNSTFIPFKEAIGSQEPVSIKVLSQGQYQNLNLKFTKSAEALLGESANGKIKLKISQEDSGAFNFVFFSELPQKYRVEIQSSEKTLDSGRMREFLFFSDDVERESIATTEVFDQRIKWAGVDFNYHLFAVVFPQKESSLIRISDTTTDGVEKGKMTIDIAAEKREMSFKLVYTEKEYDHLLKLGGNLNRSVDFGMFSLISIPILRGLQFFYKYVHNYGIAIIILTIIMRLFTFPLQYKSFKSMKKMQVIQPELSKIRDKFKDDPQRLQKESMELFKRSGVNPLSGCFPMLLQMPIFFAFYSVLREAIELVNAPFVGWISDLSDKDPFYVLPILLTVAMFFHQKLTPTPSADPNQKKIMMFMPLIFGVFMLNLPAGLSLYILISTIFGMFQQLFVYKRA